MTNTTDTQDLIRRAAEYVGWASSTVPGTFDSNGVGWRTIWTPSKNRSDLHALVGLVEDKVREKYDLGITFGDSTASMTAWLRDDEDIAAESYVTNKDHLIARLGALMQLVDKLDEKV